MQVCPEVFEVRSDGYLYILQEEPPAEAARPGPRGGRDVPDRRHHARGVTRPSGFHARSNGRPRRSGRCCASASTPTRHASPTCSTGARRHRAVLHRDRRRHRRPGVCVQAPDRPLRRHRAEDQLERVCQHVRETVPDVVLVLDAKRGDIGSTAEHYAREAFGRYGADAVTVNPYLGTDAVLPFLELGGVIALCRTSNPGGDELQDLARRRRPLYLPTSPRWWPTMVAARRLRAGGGRDLPRRAGRRARHRPRPADPACRASAPRAATSRPSSRRHDADGRPADVHVGDVHAGVAEQRADRRSRPGRSSLRTTSMCVGGRHVEGVIVDHHDALARDGAPPACRDRSGRHRER
jgi:hypothetical protein